MPLKTQHLKKRWRGPQGSGYDCFCGATARTGEAADSPEHWRTHQSCPYCPPTNLCVACKNAWETEKGVGNVQVSA